MFNNYQKTLNEILSISDEVLSEADILSQKIKTEINNKISNTSVSTLPFDKIGTYTIVQFIYNIFDTPYEIIVKNYITTQHPDYLYMLGAVANVQNKTLYLDTITDNPKYFENAITHEILHIYQYQKNQKDYYTSDSLYNMMCHCRDNIEQYDATEQTFIQALYISYDFEQDAMVHGLYRELNQYFTYQIQFIKKDTDEYAYLEDIKNAIKNINDFDEELFDNQITKHNFLIKLKKAEKRYSTKIDKIIQHLYNDRENINEGFSHFSHYRSKTKS